MSNPPGGLHASREVPGGRTRYSFPRHFLRWFIHFFSYHLILRQSWTRSSRVAGFRLRVPPTVFHPRFFITSEYFANFLGGIDLSGKRVADVGTGSGILALSAARAGATHVVAIDINPQAAIAATSNARRNGLAGRVSGVCSDLMSSIAPRQLFDVIISSPPSFSGEPRDIADRAWHAGPDYRDIAALFAQARERLVADGHFYLLLSSDSDLELLGDLISQAGFDGRLVGERKIVIESFLLYDLRPRKAG